MNAFCAGVPHEEERIAIDSGFLEQAQGSGAWSCASVTDRAGEDASRADRQAADDFCKIWPTRSVITWVKLMNFATAVEAEFLVQQLESAGLHAVARGNDIVGIFGHGFGGPTAGGVDVMVTSDAVDSAKEILGEYGGRIQG